MNLDPLQLASIYECLRSLKPFSSWKLPNSDAIEFRTPARADVWGEFREPNIITVSSTQQELTDLQTRMDAVYERYLKQLSAMDTAVSQMNSLRDSLSGQFDGLMSMYTKK